LDTVKNQPNVMTFDTLKPEKICHQTVFENENNLLHDC